jgi:hypothetical protein
VEWGIGGLKRKWRMLMKRFDNTNQDIHTFSNMEPYWVDAQSSGSLL